ncbi:MAG TPA: argininosuccinate lyase [Pyrinomonadaceae bacterium]|jgi:argininosuccinate lyase|nr:argininosuccinate lyase [Pyrinomonadaceae bacterium]
MGESKKLWGGRFEGKTDPGFAEFNNSFRFDRRLFGVDVTASIAYAEALVRASVLTVDEGNEIRAALESMLEKGNADELYFNESAEDVHSFVEARLIDLVGDLGRKLHTGRSRNDQVATDFRLWLRNAIDDLSTVVHDAQTALLDFAENNREVVIPGYTHLQRAQPVLLAHWCLAYFEMLARDRDRLSEVRARVNVLPLGSAALAGTSFKIDRESLASSLGFATVSRNSLDAVSDRDFCIEFLSASSLIMVHLSRLAEDIILYATNEFGLLELGDAIATGSSLMPQKKNPDSMELVRGKAGRVFGDLLALLTTLKGLPLAYNKDMQEDKEALFDAYDTVAASLKVSATVLRNISINKDRASTSSTTGYMNATELADYLVRKGMPFREAHEVVGKIVMRAIELDKELDQLSLAELREFSTIFAEDVHTALSLEETLKSKSQTGGTAPDAVASALTAARQSLSK